MTRLICLALLGLILAASPSSGQNEEDLLVSSKNEIGFLRSTLISISEESKQIQQLLQDALTKNEQLRNESEKEQRRLQSKIDSLEQEKKEAEESLKKPKKDSEVLTGSKDTLGDLEKNYDDEIEIWKGQVRLRDWLCSIGIGIGAGMTTYEITKDPWASLGGGTGGALLTYLLLKLF